MIDGYTFIEDCTFLDCSQSELVGMIDSGQIKDVITMSADNYYIANDEIERLLREQQKKKRSK